MPNQADALMRAHVDGTGGQGCTHRAGAALRGDGFTAGGCFAAGVLAGFEAAVRAGKGGTEWALHQMACT